MRRVERVICGLAVMVGAAVELAATPFAYHDYDSMVADLEALASEYPQLTELSTGQDLFGLANDFDDGEPLGHYVLRITNEISGLDKPEVLLVGGQHGDEIVGLEVVIELARLLLGEYGSDPWLTELVDRREIYLVPLANPWGFRHGLRRGPGTEGNEDMNRDHVYDRCEGFGCTDLDALSTIGARTLHELARRHNFRVMLDYHGGVELILHPWGSPVHGGETESPDHLAANRLGLRMQSYGGDYNGLSPVGTATELLGPATGPLDDTSYAAGWDVANADPAWPVDSLRALAYTIEISNQKMPPVDTLGGDSDLLTSGAVDDGYVPKNIRVGLAAIDIAEPYLLWTNRDSLPTTVAVGQSLSVEWQVRGCFEVDDTHVRAGIDPDPVSTFSMATATQQQTTGTPCFGSPTTFAADVSFGEAGTYYLAPVARVDSSLLDQVDPNPDLSPQSWVVRSRTEADLLLVNSTDPNEVNTVQGRLIWGAEPLEIEVEDGIFADGFESGDTSAWK